MSVWSRGLAVVFMGALSLTACRRTAHDSGEPGGVRAGTTTLTGALVYVPSDIAREQLAQARCEHERKCEHIDETYLSECIAQEQAELQPRVGPRACPGGIDDAALRDCLDWTAHRASCDDEREGAKRRELCNPAKLCPQP